MNWLYNEKEITDISEFPQGTFGFVYEVTTPSGKNIQEKKPYTTIANVNLLEPN